MRTHHSTDRWVPTEIPIDADELIDYIDALPQYTQEESPVEVEEAMAKAIATLTADEWNIFEQHFIYHVSFRTIAYEMAYPKTRVWEIAQTAKAKLAKHLMTENAVTERYALEPSWNDACRAALMDLAPTGRVAAAPFEWYWMKLRDCVNFKYSDYEIWYVMHAIGSIAAIEMDSDGTWSVDEMERLLCSKQHDYGCENILAFGMTGIAVRTSDKLARYFNLQGRDAANESMKDTLMDLVGYAVIAIMLDNGTFERPLTWPID